MAEITQDNENGGINLEFGKADFSTYERGMEKEWLLTNGIGGFSSLTITGANARRYHGLLTAALEPPVERHLIISNLHESVETGGMVYNLSSFKTNDFTMEGFRYLQRFVQDPVPKFTYNIGDVFIDKKVCMIYMENTVCVIYHVINGSKKLKLEITPLVNFRDYHQNSTRSHMVFESSIVKNGVTVKPYNLDTNIYILISEGEFFKKDDCWFYNMYYSIEAERGLYPTEDHYIPGTFKVTVEPHEEKYISVTASLERDTAIKNGLIVIENEKKRLEKLTAVAGFNDKFASDLAKACDNFIVYRKSTNSKTVIAGYPWFTDWGRDTMISFTGLTLVTGRFDDAREILYTFATREKDGLIPNMFPDKDSEPAYNTVDASLWFFEAVFKYLEYTDDYSFIQENIYDVLKRIIDCYMEGTHYNIHMDRDFLIYAGDANTQLTWMDAQAGGVPVTPRYGKVVEINALWYNALCIMKKLAENYRKNGDKYGKIAENTRKSFLETFWNKDGNYLYDVVTENYKDDRLRPNQIISLSLSYPIIGGQWAKAVLQKVWRKLYTAYGLRTLTPDSPYYQGIYSHDAYTRDISYHQGTVWVWLLGHFITAFVRVNGYDKNTVNRAKKFIEPFKDHLRVSGLGCISEIFDGNEPNLPRGCFAQAWSTAEILRAYIEDIMRK
jgi:predicted glycogen debranching enzyme